MSYFKSKEFFDSAIALLKNKWLPFVLGIPLFFCLHHYEGIVNDARLYLLQVIHGWFPERFVNDPPFMFGNQDAYGLFTPFYALIIKNFSIESGTFYFTLFGQFLWIVAGFYFIHQFVKRFGIRLWFTPLMLLFIVYSGFKMPNTNTFFFGFIENFNCSRLFSIGFAILGIGFCLAQKKFIGLSLFLFGTLVHPLTAGWCLPLWLFFYYPKTKYPIIILSFIFPLTFLFHRGPFDIYPLDWGNCTHNHDITFQMVWRMFLGVFFFGVVVKKYTFNQSLLKLTNALFFVLLIGLYWSLTGGIGKHILIYQFQTWRIEWLFFIFFLPVYFLLFVDKRFRKQQFNTRKLAFYLLGYVVFMPNSNILILLLAIGLLCPSPRKIGANFILVIIATISLVSTGLQELILLVLQDALNIKIDVSCLYNEVDNLLFAQFIMIICVCLRWLNSRRYRLCCSLLLFVFFILFPQYQLMPIFAVFVAFFIEKKISIKFLVPVLILCVWDCTFNTEFRNAKLLNYFPWQVRETLQQAFLLIVAFIAYFIVANISWKMRTLPLIACALILVIWGLDGYDARKTTRIVAEKDMEKFKSEMIFSQIKNRGKMFYYVLGEYVSQPRLQFLSGAYFDESSYIGQALYKQQFETTRKRDNLIFFKKEEEYIASKKDYENFVKATLANKDSLLDRVTFLCSINEISHLVSNLRLSELERLDLYQVNESEIVYLYGCPNAKD